MKIKFAILLCLGLLCQFSRVGAGNDPSPVAAATAPPSPVLEAPVPAPALALAAISKPDTTVIPPAAPAAVAKAPLGVDLVEAAQNKAEEISGDDISPLVTYDEAELIPVIKALARQAHINLVFDPRMTTPGPDGKLPVTPTVTLRLENITARNVLDTVLKNYGYVLVEDQKTRIGRVAPKDDKAPEPLFTKVLLLQYTSPTNIMTLLRLTFSNPRNQFVPDVRTSQLVVMATEADLVKIEQLIVSLDQPTRQILIEAKLIETSHNPQSVKGIDWSGTLQAQKVSFGNGLSSANSISQSPGAATTATTPSGRVISSTAGSSSQSSYTTTMNGTPGTAPGISLNTARGFAPNLAFLSADGVSAVLSFLNQDADTEVVATPRAVTLDNETATLSVIRAIPVRTSSPGSANVAATSQVGYTNVGTVLVVTPRVSGGTNVAMKVAPEVSNVDGQQSSVVDGKINTDAIFAFRRVEASVVVPSGHTLVMGGLISDRNSKAYTKVPLLGDIPLLGMAFRKEDKQKTKQNLIIFITPTILQTSDFQTLPGSGFLQTQDRIIIPEKTSSWDSGTPHDWGKGKEK